MSLSSVILTTFLSGLIIFCTRVFPFVLFSKKEPPSFIRFVEKYIPPMIIAILVFYCLKDVQVSTKPYGIPHFIALATTVILHLWKNNSMISIFGGTIMFMIIQNYC